VHKTKYSKQKTSFVYSHVTGYIVYGERSEHVGEAAKQKNAALYVLSSKAEGLAGRKDVFARRESRGSGIT
jgi:hypothetical protein